MKMFAYAGIAALTLLAACAGNSRFSSSEAERIDAAPGDGILRVLKTNDRTDSLGLRTRSKSVGRKLPADPRFGKLKQRMLCTVNDPSDPGVGIAAPQTGIPRRLIAVQRFDKPGEPFEFYADPRIARYEGADVSGPEGCLSIPDRTDTVVRRERIQLRWRDEKTGRRRRETVSGFTAVIFQHEIDHLDGVLFIDRAKAVRPQWKRKPFRK